MNRIVTLLTLAVLMVLGPAGVSGGEDPPNQGVCAKVKLEIAQQLTFERVGFEGRLRISNDEPFDITGLLVDLVIYTEDGDIPTTPPFFIQEPRIDGMIGGPDGTGIIPAGSTASIDWLFIPTVDAGGEDPLGQTYYIGGAMTAMANGEPFDYPLLPDDVTVAPQPKLDIDYFLPRDVMADDPFTSEIEESIPFDLGVRINNIGFGDANNMRLSSGQPQIVENEKGLLIAFRLLESFTHGSEVGDPSLNMNFGDITAQEARIGRWTMISTLMGEFIEFDATYTHRQDLGGDFTSLIVDLDANFLTKTMLINEPGFDDVEDFLADTTKEDDDLMPETIFSSEGQEFPVNPVESSVEDTPTPEQPIVELVMENAPSGWVYTRVDDPSQGNLDLVSVTRSDGKDILTPENAWVTSKVIRLVGQPVRTEYTLHIVDINSTGIYDLEYQTPPPDTVPPVTNVIMQDPFFGSDPEFYGTLETEFFLNARDDVSGVANTLWSVDGEPFTPSFPFRFFDEEDEGLHTFEYYSVDFAGNAEPVKAFNFTVDLNPPVIDQFNGPSVYTPNTDAVAVFNAQAIDDFIPKVDLTLEIASAAKGAVDVLYSETIRTDSGKLHYFTWDGRSDDGVTLSPGVYTARLIAADPLDHTVTDELTLTIEEPFPSDALNPGDSDQLNPDVSGMTVVYQDNGNGDWDVAASQYGGETEVYAMDGNQTRPRIDGNLVVYQDDSAGNSDVYLLNLDTGDVTPIATTPDPETRPDIHGDSIVWSKGNEIELYTISTAVTETIAFGGFPLENPRIHNGVVVFEDFRTGLSNVTAYVIATGEEFAIGDAAEQQEEPDIYDGQVVWTDKRIITERDLYTRVVGEETETQLTDTDEDEAESSLSAAYTAFTDYTAGLADPNIAIIAAGEELKRQITSDPASQRRPAAGLSLLAWEDSRSGRSQIRAANLNIPFADAGGDQVTSSGQPVTLDGSGSFTLLGDDQLDYQWEQHAGTAVTLTGETTAMPAFTVPDVSDDEILIFSLVVENGDFASAADTVSVTVRAENQPPIADAGPDQVVNSLAKVTLDGSASSDPDEDPLTASWSVVSSPTVALEVADGFAPMFTAPEVTTPTLVVVELTVNDGQYDSLPDAVEILVNPRTNQPPVAVIGNSLAVDEGEAVTLNGLQSYDPDGETIRYTWRQISGLPVALSSFNVAEPEFVAPQVNDTTVLEFALLVSDGELASEQVIQRVTVRNILQAPVADAGPDAQYMDRQVIALDGTGSFHPDNQPFNYIWRQRSGPNVTLNNASTAEPSFDAPIVSDPDGETLVFQLIVADSIQPSSPDIVEITIMGTNTRPVADAGDNIAQEGDPGAVVTITLDGAGSSDLEDDPLTYAWTVVSGDAELDNPASPAPSFTAPIPAAGESVTYEFELVVDDGEFSSQPATVEVTLTGVAPERFTIF